MKTKAIVGVALVLPLMAAAADKLISYDSEKMKAYAPDNYNSKGDTRTPTNAIDGSGLNSDGTHGTTPKGTMWMSKAASSNANLPKWFIVDLGEVKSLSKLHIWNFNQANYAYRGIKKMSIYASTAEMMSTTSFTASDWALKKADVTLEQASGAATYAGEDVIFDSAVMGRWIAFSFSEYYNNSTKDYYCGLAEIQFYEEGASATFTAAFANPSETTASSALVRGTLYLPSTMANVTTGVVWGKTTGGETIESWEGSMEIGSLTAGDFSATITGLEAETGYTFAFYAKNPDDTLSFSETGTFTTFLPTTCVWTGAAGDGDWSNADNWNTTHAPHFVDTVSFPSEATGTVTIGEDVSVLAVDFGTSTVTLAGEGSLTTAAITLGDAEAGESPVQSELAVALNPAAVAGTTNFVFTIGANRVLKSSADINPADKSDTVLRKIGAGTFLRTAQVSTDNDNPPFAGAWALEEGTIELNGGSVVGLLRGTFHVGGAGKPAKLYSVSANSLSNPSSVYVYADGTYDFGTMNSGRTKTLAVYSGSTVEIRSGGTFTMYTIDLYGGTVTGLGTAAINGFEANQKCLWARKADQTGVMDAPISGNGYALAIKADKNEDLPVGLLLKKPLKSGNSTQSVTLSGGGVIKSIASNDSLNYKMIIGDSKNKSPVTCYLDGSTVAGGKNGVYIHYGSTLAGIGTLGNGAGTTDMAISVNGDDKLAGCTIAPGTIDNETGAHICGTLTAGAAETYTRYVEFAKNGRLLCHIGENRASDKLMVYGTVKVTGVGNQIEVVVPEDLKRARTGKYALLEARDGIVDAEGNAVAEPFAFTCANKKVTFGVEKNTEGKIVKIYANVPPQGLTVTVR